MNTKNSNLTTMSKENKCTCDRKFSDKTQKYIDKLRNFSKDSQEDPGNSDNNQIPRGLENQLRDIAQMSHGIVYRDFLGKSWDDESKEKAYGYCKTLKSQLRNNGKINEESRTYQGLVELLKSLPSGRMSDKLKKFSRGSQKEFSRVDDEDDVIAKFDTILKNLRQDNPKYEGEIRRVTNDVELRCKFTREVWGDYDAPVNKMFDRSGYVTLDLRSGDRFVLITGRGSTYGKPLAYLTKSKNKWYFLESSALSKLNSNSESYDPSKKDEKEEEKNDENANVKIDSIESARTSAHNYAKKVFGDSYDKKVTDEVFNKLSKTYNYLDPVAIFKIYQNSCHGGFRRKKDDD